MRGQGCQARVVQSVAVETAAARVRVEPLGTRQGHLNPLVFEQNPLFLNTGGASYLEHHRDQPPLIRWWQRRIGEKAVLRDFETDTGPSGASIYPYQRMAGL